MFDINRISFAVNKLNYTHDMLLEAKDFNISIISEAFICPWCKHPASDFEKVVK